MAGFTQDPVEKGLPALTEAPRPFDFTWGPVAGGYTWRFGRTSVEKRSPFADKAPSQRRLELTAEWGLVRRYEVEDHRDEHGLRRDCRREEAKLTKPLRDTPALFREFASLDASNRDSILAFANEHGMLGRYAPLVFDPPPAEYIRAMPAARRKPMIEYFAGRRDYPEDGDGLPLSKATRFQPMTMVRVAEFHSMWKHAIGWMKATLLLWDLAAARDEQGLSQYVTCTPMDKPRTYKDGFFLPRSLQPRWAWQAIDADGDIDFFIHHSAHPARPGEIIEVTRDHVIENINRELRRMVQPQIVIDPRTGRPVMQMYPDDLLTAMWLQLAHAVTGNKQYRQCRDCASWFEVSADDDGRTARRLFCTDACKSRDYRRRKDRAVALGAEGLGPKKIAAKLKAEGLETDSATIKKWKAGRRRRRPSK